ncbi:DNA repair protein RecN [Ectothiorhodospiraceae bacterium BW-2]|nr:DNA repair protein RecN [Ectothiorhodospiraceae bacterium BW-2]
MLRRLHIRHYAIVSELTLEFHRGMTVLSGETGAGKSILLDALGLTLGDRADSHDIAAKEQRADISANFDIDNLPLIHQWLAERELDEEGGECIIRRTINRDGRSRAYINGQAVPLRHIRELGEHLIELHGQHAHQNLLKAAVQRQQLDLYCHQPTLLQQVQQSYHHWHRLLQQQQQLQQRQQQRQDRLDLLLFQTNELQQLNLQPGELEQIEQDHRRLSHLQEIVSSCQQALFLLEESEQAAINSTLVRVSEDIAGLAELDPALQSCAELLDSASIQLTEAINELRHYSDRLELDPERQQQLEQRLADIQQLARKQRIAPHELPERLQQLQQELQQLQNQDELSQQLDTQIAQALVDYQQLAQQLTVIRQQGAQELAAIVTKTMRNLGMSKGELQILLQPQTAPCAYGNEEISFQISLNPGQPLRPLERVASGGELSRISLAIQVNSADQSRIPTMIFDEIDVGIGGQTAAMVGQLLRRLGERCQVICVTHQPQVAASGHLHYQISKLQSDTHTETRVTPLNETQRISEIARMSGGLEMTEETLNHAATMIERMQTK